MFVCFQLVLKSASLRARKIKSDFLCRVYENSGDTWGKNISIRRSSVLTQMFKVRGRHLLKTDKLFSHMTVYVITEENI